MLDVSDLIERCRQDDDLAWEALVRRTQGRVYAVAYSYMRNREEARDAAQEIFIKVYRGLHTLQGDDVFMPWLLRLARNCCIDRLRRLKVRTPEIDVAVEDAPEIPASGPSPEATSIQGDRVELLYRALDELSDQSREIIQMKDIQELKLSEIAEMLSLPLGTVKSRSFRARIELAAAVRQLDPSYGA